MSNKTVISRKTPKYLRPAEKNEYTLKTSLRKTPYVLDKNKKVTIGRGSKNTIKIPQQTTSDLNTSIKWEKSHFVVKDEKSINGTYVNNKRIKKPTRLEDGDKVKVGRYVFTFKVKKIRLKK